MYTSDIMNILKKHIHQMTDHDMANVWKIDKLPNSTRHIIVKHLKDPKSHESIMKFKDNNLWDLETNESVYDALAQNPHISEKISNQLIDKHIEDKETYPSIHSTLLSHTPHLSVAKRILEIAPHLKSIIKVNPHLKEKLNTDDL